MLCYVGLLLDRILVSSVPSAIVRSLKSKKPKHFFKTLYRFLPAPVSLRTNAATVESRMRLNGIKNKLYDIQDFVWAIVSVLIQTLYKTS